MGQLGRDKSQHGFSLVELMAVLFILALVAGLVVMNLPAQSLEKDAAERLAERLDLEARTGVFDGEVRTLAVAENRWELRNFSGGQWQMTAAGELPGRVSLVVEDLPVELTPEPQPLILFEPSGFATPFELSAGGVRDGFRLVGDANGDVRIERRRR